MYLGRRNQAERDKRHGRGPEGGADHAGADPGAGLQGRREAFEAGRNRQGRRSSSQRKGVSVNSVGLCSNSDIRIGVKEHFIIRESFLKVASYSLESDVWYVVDKKVWVSFYFVLFYSASFCVFKSKDLSVDITTFRQRKGVNITRSFYVIKPKVWIAFYAVKKKLWISFFILLEQSCYIRVCEGMWILPFHAVKEMTRISVL